MLKEYRRGKINITFGSDTVTGIDTSWLTYCGSGDVLHVGDQSMAILGVVSNTELLLVDTWAGTSGGSLSYRVQISHDSLDRGKKVKLDWVHMERDVRCVADVIAYDRPWQADLRSQDLLNKAVGFALAGAPLPTTWRDSNNNNMPITSLEQLVVIGGAMAQQTEIVYHRSWELKAAIWAATSEEELSLIEWEIEPPS